MPNSTEMNDWKEYQNQLHKEMDKQVTSNKALLWVGIAVNGIFTVITLVIAIVALINALMIGRDNLSLQKEVTECKSELRTSVQSAEVMVMQAKRAYDNARQRESRRTRAGISRDITD